MSLKDTPQCNAESKGSGETCLNPAMENSKCRMHGGSASKDFVAANYKDGRNSKYLKYLSANRQQRFDDNAGLHIMPSVDEEINLLTLQIQDLTELLDDSTLLENQDELRENVQALRKVIGHSRSDESNVHPLVNVGEAEAILDRIDEIFTAVNGNSKVWHKITDLTERMRKMQETEVKLHMQLVEIEKDRRSLVSVEIFNKFVKEVGKQFKLSPDNIARIQTYGLAKAFDALPKALRDAPPSKIYPEKESPDPEKTEPEKSENSSGD